MEKQMLNKKESGITLVSLAVTIVVMMILVISVTASISTTTEVKTFNEIKEDIIMLTEEVKNYYLSNGALPVDESYSMNLNIPEEYKNPNDEGIYYPINIALLGADLNRGVGNKNFNYTTTDLYVIDKSSLTVYYMGGTTLNGKTFYTLSDEFSASNSYTKTELPIIASVTLQSNGKSKIKATELDTVTLKIVTNYMLTQLPIVKINGTEVETSWNEKIGIATYIIPQDNEMEDGEQISVDIYGYVADDRAGDEITKVNFGQGVYYQETKKIINEVPIPKGLYYVGGTKESGLVISDNKADKGKYKNKENVGTDLQGNQFVWIPVEEIADYKRTAYSINVGTGIIDTNTNSEKINFNNSENDYFTETLQMEERISVIKNKGFYIGRYEAGDAESTKAKKLRTNKSPTTNTVTVKSGQAPYDYVTKVRAQNLAEEFSLSQKYVNVRSRLISSYAWDTAIAFIQKTNSDYGISSEEGNYKNTTFKYIDITGTSATKAKEDSILIPTGQTTAVKNIYDMGGNTWEWTTENYSNAKTPFVGRGAGYNRNYAEFPAGRRDYDTGGTGAYKGVGFRVTLFFIETTE